MAEGSLNGLLKGKFYNRCTRIHQLLAAALEKALFIKYLEHNNDDKLLASSIIDQGDLSQELTGQLVEDVRVINLMDRYETYLHSVMKGDYGHTAAYWATYMYILSTGFIVSSYAQYVQMTLKVTLMSYQASLTFVFH